MAIHLDRRLPAGSRDLPGRWCKSPPVAQGHDRPYSVLLLMGFTMPVPLPVPRCALTAPFHPYLPPKGHRRSALCGTFPRVAPAGRYPASCFYGARTFLPGACSGAAIRPSDAPTIGGKRCGSSVSWWPGSSGRQECPGFRWRHAAQAGPGRTGAERR